MKTSKMMLGLASAFGLLVSGPSHAVFVSLDNLGTGAISAMSMTILDMGTTQYPTTPLAPSYVCGNDGSDIAAGISDCNANSLNNAGGAINPGEDTWAVFTITSISLSNGRTWAAGTAPATNEYLTGMFYNSFDYGVQFDGTEYTSRASGGIMDVYRWNQAMDLGAFANVPGNRTGISSYDAGVGNMVTGTAANLYMQLAAVDFQSVFSCVGNDPTCQNANATTDMFLNVVDGAGNFDTNTVTDTLASTFDPVTAIGPLVDLRVYGTPGCTNGGTTCGEWTTVGTLNGQGFRIPEPGSLALAGLGLVGMGFSRRRKQA